MGIYDDAATALHVASRRGEKQLTLFCPIIKDTCRSDCVSFVTPDSHPMGKTKFRDIGGFCDNTMISRGFD